jgi:hypothetical protein
MATIEVDEAVKRSMSFAARMADVTEGELSDLRAMDGASVIARDKHCAWPGGCNRRPGHCDVHHVHHVKHKKHVSRARPDRKPSPPVYRAASPIR